MTQIKRKLIFASQRKYNPSLKTNMFFCNLFESVYVEREISIFGFNAFILKRGKIGLYNLTAKSDIHIHLDIFKRILEPVRIGSWLYNHTCIWCGIYFFNRA